MTAGRLALLLALAGGAAAADPATLLVGDGPRFRTATGVGTDRGIAFVGRAWSVVGPGARPSFLALGDGRALLVWAAGDRAAWAVVGRVDRRVVEGPLGAWPVGWSAAAAADVDGDGRADLLLVRAGGVGDGRSYGFRIARGLADGGFDLSGAGPPRAIVEGVRAAFFALGDVDGDGAVDLVFHGVPHGGRFETRLRVLPGTGDGGLAGPGAVRDLVVAPQGSTGPVLLDADGDGDLDIFLPPDDDVADRGQAYLATGDGSGGFAVAESIDLDPADETASHDAFIAGAIAVDADGDGRTDLVVRSTDLRTGFVRLTLHRATEDGFDADGRLLADPAEGPGPAAGWVAAPVETPGGAPLVDDLDALDPVVAARAVAGVAGLGEAAVGLLAGRLLRPDRRLEAVDALVAKLDDEDFEVRRAASDRLLELGEAVRPMLGRVLEGEPSVEVRWRIEAILAALSTGDPFAVSPGFRLRLRGVTVLAGLAGGRELLERLAEEAPEEAVCAAAREALALDPAGD